jgi:hypothetical protein
MKEEFREHRFSDVARQQVELCDEIIEDYQAQGLRLTLRQLYYQLVRRNVIPNQERSYKNLGSLVSSARLAGLLDWDAIEDRVRRPIIWAEYAGPESFLQREMVYYRRERWADQPYYVELWVEKDALAGVLEPIASAYHVPLMVNRGYSSQSAMYAAAERFKDHPDQMHQLLYLGDHDPSGEDMVRDISDRLELFGAECTVEKVALTMSQIRKLKPLPQPAKKTDSRSAHYIEQHGSKSWELDALDPDLLAKMVRAALEAMVDRPLMDRVIVQEKREKEALFKAVKKLFPGKR